MNKLSLLLTIGLCFSLKCFSCEDWFKLLKITDQKNCISICTTAKTDMATYMCPEQCNNLCKLKKDATTKEKNFYDLTDDEIEFCEKNKITCIKAYELSVEAEKACQKIYLQSNTNDESDACRHFMWSSLMAKELGETDAIAILNAHENNPKQDLKEKEMDLHNNIIALSLFKKNKISTKSTDEILE